LEKKNLLPLPNSAKLPVDQPQPGHNTEVSGGFLEIIRRFHEAIKRFSNFFQSNSFKKKFTSFSLLVYTRHSLSMNK